MDQLKQVREALQIGLECAQKVANDVHQKYAGFNPPRHAAVEADVAKIDAALAALAASQPDTRDAVRYRWLRARHVDAGMVEVPEIKCWPEGTKAYQRIGGFGADLDAQIDREIDKYTAAKATAQTKEST